MTDGQTRETLTDGPEHLLDRMRHNGAVLAIALVLLTIAVLKGNAFAGLCGIFVPAAYFVWIDTAGRGDRLRWIRRIIVFSIVSSIVKIAFSYLSSHHLV